MPSIRFDAIASRVESSTILRLPEQASKKLPSRGQVAVRGTLNDLEFQTVLEPDGLEGHWIKLDKRLATGLKPGDTAALDIEPTSEWPEPQVPDDLAAALDHAPEEIQLLWKESGSYSSGIVEPLAARLAKEGFEARSSGQAMDLTVTFDSCPVTLREWETTAETEPFEGSVEVERLKVKYRTVGCMTSTTTGPSTTTTVRGQYYDVEYTTPGATTTTVYGCYEEPYTDGETETVTVLEERVENYGVSHRAHHAAATGTIRIAFDGGVREQPFALEADSDDDLSYNPHHGADRHGFHHLSEPQARDRLHGKLVAAIVGVQHEVLEARAAPFVAEGVASAAAGRTAEADHAFFVASQITKRPSPAFSEYMARQYAVTPEVVAAAVQGRSLPRLDLVAGHEVVLPPVPIKQRAAYYEMVGITNWDRRRMLMLTATAGPAGVRHGAGDVYGVRGALAMSLLIPNKTAFSGGFAFRYDDGIDGSGTRHLGGDLMFQGGLLVKGLALTPVVGVGADGAAGDGSNAGDRAFRARPGAFVEYGLRFGYAFRAPLTFDATYTKAFRSAGALPVEKRLDVRLIVITTVVPLAVTARYAEYLYEGDGFIAPFGPEGRAAQSLSVLGGVGF